MNEDLLETNVVKECVRRWISEGYAWEGLKAKLESVHLIIVDDNLLKFYVETILGLKSPRSEKELKSAKTEKYIKGDDL